ncbi:MAG: hypothetical protein ACOCQW_02040 [Halanaerobiaceae bacterium]
MADPLVDFLWKIPIPYVIKGTAEVKAINNMIELDLHVSIL